MGSVRERIERELREAPEVVVPTSNRRVALAAGGSVSTRQTQERRNDAANPEVAAPREVTSSASCDFGNADSFSRVRDRLAPTEAMKPEAARPRTQADIDAEGWAEMHERWDDEAKASEQAKTQARQKREADERAAADARRQAEAAHQRKAQYAFAENAVLHECSDLSPAEQQMFWERLVAMNACLDAGNAAIIAESIRLARKV